MGKRKRCDWSPMLLPYIKDHPGCSVADMAEHFGAVMRANDWRHPNQAVGAGLQLLRRLGKAEFDTRGSVAGWWPL